MSLHLLKTRERQINVMAQFENQRVEIREIARAKWRMARHDGANEWIIERLGFWAAGFEQ